MTILHPFESAGLGVAPFRLVSVEDRGRVTCGCDFCGTGIRFVFHIRDVNGQTFKVGSDCVAKTCTKVDTTLAFEVRKALDALEETKREARRVQRAQREAAKWQAAKDKACEALAALNAVPDLFNDEPHPIDYRRERGEKLRGYLQWILTESYSTNDRVWAAEKVLAAAAVHAGS